MFDEQTYAFSIWKQLYVETYFGIVWSYLPFFLYDATLLESDDNRKSIVEIINFNLRPSLSFRTMGAFYHSKSSSSSVLLSKVVNLSVNIF